MHRRDFIQRIASAGTGSLLFASTCALEAAPAPRPRISLGIDMFAASGFASIQGLRVGLLTHLAGVNMHRELTLDVLRRARGIRLVKLFGPEHGLFGKAAADVPVQSATDSRTGLPVYSLYGKTRRPTPAMLSGLDVMLIDLQDIGSRTYTYVSCMKLVIEACFEAGVKVIVLDRPNPLGGLKVDGPGLDKKWMSYVGSFQVPYVHGLTIGELALLATRTPGWLNLSPEARKKGHISVIKMGGWKRAMRWQDTGLHWMATSPMVQHIEAAEGYPMTGLGCQLDDNDFSHGTKTLFPFRFIQFPGKKAAEIASQLRRRKIRGLGLNPIRLTDGTEGVYLSISNWEQLRPTELNFHMMQLSCLWQRKNPFASLTKAKKELQIKHIGSEAFFSELCRKGSAINVSAWMDRWTREANVFKTWARRHWIYS
ncbi:MAG: DUF1343 domain-containing protein [Puniceicoccales bacterium]|jgi:uncharacterized protein YbbC (DUF1343 family)|nr:DUF1343 domain-containing protein [Puniceicoccales bacterium]